MKSVTCLERGHVELLLARMVLPEEVEARHPLDLAAVKRHGEEEDDDDDDGDDIEGDGRVHAVVEAGEERLVAQLDEEDVD